MIEKNAFQFRRSHLEPVVFDEFLRAVRDVEIPVSVYTSYIARPEPTVCVKACGCRCRITQVALEYIGSFEEELSCLVGGNFIPLLVAELCVHAGEKRTDGAGVVTTISPALDRLVQSGIQFETGMNEEGSSPLELEPQGLFRSDHILAAPASCVCGKALE